MRSRWGDRRERGRAHRERGSVTAEFAAVVPAVLLLLACCLAGMQIIGQQVRLQDAAADVSRSVARGGDTAAAAQVGASVAVAHRGDLVCAILSARSRPIVGGALSVALSASSCALAGGG
jgi:Flp pilus assembly protein TadG